VVCPTILPCSGEAGVAGGVPSGGLRGQVNISLFAPKTEILTAQDRRCWVAAKNAAQDDMWAV